MKKILIWLMVLCLLPCTAFAQQNTTNPNSISRLQQRLNELGLNAGAADGIFGQKTSAAVLEAQRLLLAAGYEIAKTGKADAQTMALIFDEEAQDALLTLRKGSKGERVRVLQNRLIDLKLLSGMADGDYGSRTENAVKQFQLRLAEAGAAQLTPDGAATPEVLAWLEEDLSSYGFVAPVWFDENDPLSLAANHLYAPACILIDAPSGEVLFEVNADEQRYPASTTKMMTLLLALENMNPDDEVVVPQSASEIPADSSRVPVRPGEKMRISDLLYGLMIRSGNDAANAIAELCSGSVETFVTLMNERAQMLGMSQTHFVNPHGYHDEQHYSSARDLAALARYGLTLPEFCRFATCLQYTMPATSKREALVIQNTYEILDVNSDWYIPGAAGVKSGYTSAAGFCYVGAAQRGERTLIAVVLGVPGRNRAWQDMSRLFEYGFAKQQSGE